MVFLGACLDLARSLSSIATSGVAWWLVFLGACLGLAKSLSSSAIAVGNHVFLGACIGLAKSLSSSATTVGSWFSLVPALTLLGLFPPLPLLLKHGGYSFHWCLPWPC